MPGVVNNIFDNVNKAVLALIDTASSGLLDYILPLVWVTLAIYLTVWSFLLMAGKVQTPAADIILKIFFTMFLLYFMTTGLKPLIIEPALKLPQELAIATTGDKTKSVDIIQVLFNRITDVTSAMISLAISKASAFNTVEPFVMILCAILFAMMGYVLVIVVIFIMLYAAIGLCMTLCLTVIFLFFLAIPQVKSWFFSWLNTVFYYVILSVLATLFVQFFANICLVFMNAYAGVSGPMPDGVVEQVLAKMELLADVVAITGQAVLVFGVMIFLGSQLPTLASSLTQGSGGSPAGGAASIFHVLRSLGGSKAGGGAAGGGGGGGKAPTPTTGKP